MNLTKDGVTYKVSSCWEVDSIVLESSHPHKKEQFLIPRDLVAEFVMEIAQSLGELDEMDKHYKQWCHKGICESCGVDERTEDMIFECHDCGRETCDNCVQTFTTVIEDVDMCKECLKKRLG